MAGWSKRPTLFIKNIEEEVAKKRTNIAMDALQAVVSGSPVDEGSYRMNHRVTVDKDDYGFDLKAGRGKDSEPEKGSLSVPSYIEGLEAIANQAQKPYATVTIQNNLPYAEKIENGSSEQAGDGVYGVAFDAVVEKHR